MVLHAFLEHMSEMITFIFANVKVIICIHVFNSIFGFQAKPKIIEFPCLSHPHDSRERSIFVYIAS